LIPKQFGFNTIEQNASDLRNSSSIKDKLTSLSGNQVFSNNWEALLRVKSTNRPETLQTKSIQMQTKKCAIVMDEVDGMASDRGGINSLIDFIKNAKQPIICICNDRNHPKIRTLASHCLDLQFKPPTLSDVKKLLRRVEATVNINRHQDMPSFNCPDDAELKNIVDVCKGDIRQILNHIQLWYKQLGKKSVRKFTQKDLDNSMNINDAALLLLNAHQYMKPVDYVNSKNGGFNRGLLDKLTRLTFVDYELMPFFFLESHLQLPGGNSGGFNKGAFMMRKFGNNTDFATCGFHKFR
jgi:replication factor C subunit 1